MKRSKIFLACTTALLAVVGVVAAKAHKFTVLTNAYYSVNNGCTRLRGDYYTASTGTFEGYTQFQPGHGQCLGLVIFHDKASND